MKMLPYFLRTTYWIKDYLKGSAVRTHYNDIRKIFEDPIIGSEKRKLYLVNLLKYATTHSDFYRSYMYKDLQSFPVVNKSILIQNYDRVRVPHDQIPNQRMPLSMQVTSGSTGTPFSIPMNTQKTMRRLAELKYFGEKVGFNSHEKLVHLRIWNKWQRKSRLQAIRENIIPFDISHLDDQRLGELCATIKESGAVALRGYASSIDLLIQYIAEHNIKIPSLKIIIAGSESLKGSTRELVKKNIGCHIISQYANQENGILGQEALSQGQEFLFYLNHASYFFEILSLNEDKPAAFGELGRIVLTDLFNYAFPVIRYDTGDTGIMIEGEGLYKEYSIISKLYGRRIDLVFDTRGNVVYPMAVAMLLKHYPEIVQWQFIQMDKARYRLELIIRSKTLDQDEVRNGLLALFGKDADIELRVIDEIPILASGKRKMVVNNWRA